MLEFAKDAVKILAISTAVGALIGALFGGVGAIPGAEVGFEIGLLILEFYGLAMLIEAVLNIAVDLVAHLGKFIGIVWDANGDKKQLDLAARTLADAIGILVSTILSAVAAYLLKKGGEALGKTKFAQTVGETRLAQWFKERQQLKTTRGDPKSQSTKASKPDVSTVKPKWKPFDMKRIGAETEAPQFLDAAEFSKVKLKPGQDALYILRDVDGNILKVGKTSASGAKGRFGVYRRAGKLEGKEVQLEFHPLKPSTMNAEQFEKALRATLDSEGHALPWDNTGGRLGRPGFGTPGEGLRTPKVPKEKLEELLKRHKGDLRKVGEELGVHRRTAGLWAKAYGLHPLDFK